MHADPRGLLTRRSFCLEESIQSLCRSGQLDEALDALVAVDRQGSIPSVELYRCLLKLCSWKGALSQAKYVHAHLTERGLVNTRFLGDSVVITFVKCGALEDALRVFHTLRQRSVTSWTGVIDGHIRVGQWQEALKMYQWMKEDGTHPDKYTFVTLLKACGTCADLQEGRRIHSETAKYSCASDIFVATCLMDMYAKCGSLSDAQSVFDGLTQRDMVAWTVMIAGYAQQGKSETAFQLYCQMREERIHPDSQTLVSVLQACSSLAEKEHVVSLGGKSVRPESLQKGRVIHSEIWMRGYESDVFVGSTLISMYSKCGAIESAQHIFDKALQKNVVSWNALLAGYSQQGKWRQALHLYHEMRRDAVCPDARTFVSMLQACGGRTEKKYSSVVDGKCLALECLQVGKEIHSEILKRGHESDFFVRIGLLTMYVKCGSIVDAVNIFQSSSQLDVVSWSAMIAGFAQHGEGEKAFELYQQMLEESVPPNDRTFASLLQACGSLAEKEELSVAAGLTLQVDCLHMGKVIHAEVQRRCFGSDAFVCSTLVSMYGKCGSVIDAQNVFDGMFHRDVVSWTAILMAYVQQGLGEEALLLYDKMLQEVVSVDDGTLVIALQACGSLTEKEEPVCVGHHSLKIGPLHRSKAIHAEARRMSFETDVFVGNTLMSTYGKCGSILDVQYVFDQLLVRDVISWTVLLAAHVNQGHGDRALKLYEKMLEEGVSPDEATLHCILQACGDTGALDVCVEIHRTLMSGNCWSLFLANTLINAYGKCARMDNAQDVFDTIAEPNVVSWNALIAGYARLGNYAASLCRYKEMQLSGIKPNGVTFLSILSACSHAGMVDEGVKCFNSITKVHDVNPGIEHYVTVVDLLGRAGHFDMINELLSRMPMQPNLSMWRCLLGACQKHGNLAVGKRAFDSAVRLQPNDSALYILMSNIYSDRGMWDCAEDVDETRLIEGARKKPAQSWIEIDQDVISFLVGEWKHPEQIRVLELLQELRSHSKQVTPLNISQTLSAHCCIDNQPHGNMSLHFTTHGHALHTDVQATGAELSTSSQNAAMGV